MTRTNESNQWTLALDTYTLQLHCTLYTSGDFLNWFRKSLHRFAALNSKPPSVMVPLLFFFQKYWFSLFFPILLASVEGLGGSGALQGLSECLVMVLGPLEVLVVVSWMPLGRLLESLGLLWEPHGGLLGTSWGCLGSLSGWLVAPRTFESWFFKQHWFS